MTLGRVWRSFQLHESLLCSLPGAAQSIASIPSVRVSVTLSLSVGLYLNFDLN